MYNGIASMIPRQKLESLIRKKHEHIQDLEAQTQELVTRTREAKAYLQALTDMLRLSPKEGGVVAQANELLRPGSAMSKARDAIKQAGHPLHISEIVSAIGKENSKKSRLSVAGSLAGYVRKGLIFIRPAPNTFGLIDTEFVTVEEEPPENFGTK
ncbi:MAG: winged helix-turn-helix domain-containing protein [Pseudomonadota bacterium]|nr:winged helix-turn-helix domain-containing protein [Pseudomonadota bacterium]